MASTSTSASTSSAIYRGTASRMVDADIEHEAQEALSSASSSAPTVPSVWLEAYKDPLAGIRAYSSHIALSDVNGDGDYKLLFADIGRKLRVFKGTSLVSTSALMETPVGIVSYNMDYSSPRRPSIAVAAANFVFVYRNLRPYNKFTLPSLPINPDEAAVWNGFAEEKVSIQEGVEILEGLKESGAELSYHSLELLTVDDISERESFVRQLKSVPLSRNSVISCISVLPKDREDSDGISCIVVGTEAKQVLVLEPVNLRVIYTADIPNGVPFKICCIGRYDVEFRIVVACRNGSICSIRNKSIVGSIDLDSSPCDMVLSEKNIFVACINNYVHCFSFKGRKQYSLFLPDRVTNIELLHEEMKNRRALIVALGTGEIRVYVEQTLISATQTNDVINGLRFGSFGREKNVLISTFKSGAFHVRILPRTADLSERSISSGPPPEQDIPLKIPKRSKLYIEQTQREREFSVEMHRVFQKDLCKLRVTTASAYLRTLNSGQGPLSTINNGAVRLNARVQGLGPLFKILMTVQNAGSKALFDVLISLKYDKSLYNVKSPILKISSLLPTLSYEISTDVVCIDENGASDKIRIFVIDQNSFSVPMLSAVIHMPISELLLSGE